MDLMGAKLMLAKFDMHHSVITLTGSLMLQDFQQLH